MRSDSRFDLVETPQVKPFILYPFYPLPFFLLRQRLYGLSPFAPRKQQQIHAAFAERKQRYFQSHFRGAKGNKGGYPPYL
jgi:hypothetical protein